MNEQFSRTSLLVGESGMERLSRARAAVFGVGGVGGHAAEALVRSGIGAIDIIDNDTVSLSNLNRQIIALHSTVGRYKVDVLEERIRDINPECRVTKYKVFYTPETSGGFDFSQYDYVVDAIDTVAGKIEIVMQALAAGVPVISSMGAGNKMDPSRLRVADIYDTSVCRLARVMRKELKKRGVESLKVVYSTEPAAAPFYGDYDEREGVADGRGGRDAEGGGAEPSASAPAGGIGTEPAGASADSRAAVEIPAVRRRPPGSNSFVPASAGLLIAAEVVKELSGFRNEVSRG